MVSEMCSLGAASRFFMTCSTPGIPRLIKPPMKYRGSSWESIEHFGAAPQ